MRAGPASESYFPGRQSRGLAPGLADDPDFSNGGRRMRWRKTLARVQATPGAGKMVRELELSMKKSVAAEAASALIDKRIQELWDWRGKTLARVREILRQADPEIVEEWKWGIPVWSHGGIVCTGETYKTAVKMTFAKGAALRDPSGLFNSSLEGNVRRAIDIHEGDKLDAAALKGLIRAAVALNLEGKSSPKPRRASSRRAG